MEFFLVHFQPIMFEENSTVVLNNPQMKAFSATVNANICKSPGCGADSEHKFCSMLTKSVARASLVGCKRQKLDSNADSALNVLVTYNISTGDAVCTIGHKTEDNNHNTWFSRMQRACGGDDKFTLDVYMSLASSSRNKFLLEIKEGKIGGNPDWTGLHHSFSIPLPLIEKWRQISRLDSSRLSVIVKISDDTVERIYQDNMENPLAVNKAMLFDSSTSDAILVAGNGVEVKCHKGFLSAHSDVFKAMFESELKNENSTTIQVPEMSEASVRALLAYLYCWEIKEILKSSEIALELLIAADKYNIPKLLESTQDLILSKENGWFTPSATIRLLQVAKNKGELGEAETYKLVKAKSIAVLRTIPKEELYKCLDYQQLFADQQTGMEFCCYLLRD